MRELCEELNARVMRRYGKSRRELFEELERSHLKPLPPERFAYAEWTKAKVNIDYHVAIERSYYSVPYQLAGEILEARITASSVELLLRGERVAVHARSLRRGKFTTEPAHMPSSHRKHRDWSPSRLIAWAAKVGPHTAALVEAILADRPHPEQGYRSCLGIMRLARGYGDQRLEAAAARALAAKARSYKHVESILKHGLDRLGTGVSRKPSTATPPSPPSATTTTAPAADPVVHEHVRGGEYYR